MPTPKPCVLCGEPKIQGHPKWCIECWYLRQTAEVQLQWARKRLAAVPEELRKRTVPERFWPEGRRWCSGCQSFVRIADLGGGKTKASRCRACAGASTRDGYVKATYGITKAEEDAIWAAQGHRCPICLRRVHSKRPAVDHNHKTMEVRGLLDPGEHGCNNALLAVIETACQSDTQAMLTMVDRLRVYLENPPARAVLMRMREDYVPPVEEGPGF